nr:cytochrome d ubiquinol oxidase subunit II [Paracoccaceae bacterium]
MSASELLPLVFAGLMGLSILIYVALDGYDLGVGMLLPLGEGAEKDRMVASIGPFWDANETWLVLAVGLLLVAFPVAHGMILTALYLPVALMLLGLILRGVSFEFRMKVAPSNKRAWNRAFFAGSLLTALSQGYMLGVYIMGLRSDWETVLFGVLTALCVAAGYAMIGASWLILKTDGDLQRRAVHWMRTALGPVAVGMAAISIASPLASERIYEKWFSVPE